MQEYWVVGGEYTDTTFQRLADGKSLERYGPFPSYEAARQAWQGRTMATIDNALIRYRCLTEQPGEQAFAQAELQV
jgi:hypothetical protein